MQVKAISKHVRISPRKARLVVDAVRGLSVLRAEETLQFMKKKGALPVLKLLHSAIANAEHNHKLTKKNLVVHSITANQGFVIRRFRARAFGRAGLIQKKTSHIAIVLEEKKSAAVKTEAKDKIEKKVPAKQKEISKKVSKTKEIK